MKTKETIHCDCDCTPNRRTPSELFNDIYYNKYRKELNSQMPTNDKSVLAQDAFVEACSGLIPAHNIRFLDAEQKTKKLCEAFNRCINNKDIIFYNKTVISRQMLNMIGYFGTGSVHTKARIRTDETVLADMKSIEKICKALKSAPKLPLPGREEIKSIFDEVISNSQRTFDSKINLISPELQKKKITLLKTNCRKLMARKLF